MLSQGYFCLYVKNECFLASNYDVNMITCLNGLVFHLSGDKNYFDENKLKLTANIPMPKETEVNLHNSDFIEKHFRHFYKKSISFAYGEIHIFSFEHGSLNKRRRY